MAPSVKRLPGKPDDLNSIPKTNVESQVCWQDYTYSPSTGRHRQGQPWGLLAPTPSLIGWILSQKTKVNSAQGMILKIDIWPPHA